MKIVTVGLAESVNPPILHYHMLKSWLEGSAAPGGSTYRQSQRHGIDLSTIDSTHRRIITVCSL
eukprot:scaffold1782_cov153-Skeletonema_menzelii.AAC.8